jgi:beta-phosphoglucomutase
MSRKGKQVADYQNKHFLFDFDGVISKSPHTLFEAWHFAFNKTANINIEKEEYYLLEGIGVKKTVEILGNKYGVNASNFEAVIRLKDDYFSRHYAFAVYDGVYELINSLKNRGVKTGLVTGADKHRILESVPKNFIGQFDVLVTSDDIANTKPSPAPYIRAAELLNVESKDCIVLENSPLGIQAVKAAGMFVIALKSTLPECHLSNADIILESIVHLVKIINNQLRG